MTGYRAGFIGLIGQPNAGKSTLMNFLVEEKVSIVSKKPQTTRRRILGIHTSEKGQVVFVDAPGLIQANKGLNSFLSQELDEVMDQSDALWVILNIDEEKVENLEKVIDLAVQKNKPWIAVITKADLRDKAHRSVMLSDLVTRKGGKAYIVSATENTEDAELDRQTLLDLALAMVPECPQPLYDVELFTPETTRNLVAEIVREKCFEFIHQEIPYSLATRVILFDEATHSVPHIGVEILVAKENHKGIVIGKDAQLLKQIGSEARKDIEKLMNEKVFLNLKVTCRENWSENQKIMKELGYVVNDK